ncbi:hypothetical protein IJI69_03150 [Candidatus Saccharibacteria bacterium]|nr:hypothetical protein [Candidatus Saccharibacteria bacterium]
MQNDMMPQFGAQKPKSVNQPVEDIPMPSTEPERVAFGSATPELKKQNFFSTLTKDQIMPALIAIFAMFSLIFLVSTIVLAINSSNTTTQTKVEPTTSSRSLSTETLMFSPSKIENASSADTYKMGQIVRTAEGQQALMAYANNTGTGFYLDVNWEFAAAYYGVNSSRVDQESFRVLTNEVVADLVIGRATNDKNDDVLLVILADGTVRYMPIRESLEKYTFKITGEITDVSEVVKFYHVYEMANNELTETIMVQQADGKIIDLRPQLLRIVGKDTK